LTEVSTHSYALVGRKRKHHRAHVEDVRSTSKARKTDGDREITLEGRSALLRAMHEDPSASMNTLLQVLVAGNHENDYRKVTSFRENLRRFMRMDLDVHDQMVIHYDILSQGNVEEFGRLLGGAQQGSRLRRLSVGSVRAIDTWFRFCVDPLVKREQIDNQEPCFIGAEPDDRVMRLSVPQSKALIASFISEHRPLARVEDVKSTSHARKTDGNRGISLSGRSALLRAMQDDPSASEGTLLKALVDATGENDSNKVSHFRSNLMRFMRMDFEIHEKMVSNYQTLRGGSVEQFIRLMRGTPQGRRLSRLGVGSSRAIDTWFRFCVDPLVRGQQIDNLDPCTIGAAPDGRYMRLSVPQRKALIASFKSELCCG
jgi:hypothetical protein